MIDCYDLCELISVYLIYDVIAFKNFSETNKQNNTVCIVSGNYEKAKKMYIFNLNTIRFDILYQGVKDYIFMYHYEVNFEDAFINTPSYTSNLFKYNLLLNKYSNKIIEKDIGITYDMIEKIKDDIILLFQKNISPEFITYTKYILEKDVNEIKSLDEYKDHIYIRDTLNLSTYNNYTTLYDSCIENCDILRSNINIYNIIYYANVI